MRYSNFKLCVLSLLALGCSHSSTERYKHETEVFNRYLKTTRFTVNANKSYLFICTPGSACVGCDEHLYNIFCGTKSENILLLTSSRESIFDTSPSLKSRIYFDSTGKLDRINLPIRNASIIFYENGRIKDIASVNANALDSIDYKYNAWLKHIKSAGI